MHQVRPASPPPEPALLAAPSPLVAPSNIEPPIEYCTTPPASLHCPICQEVLTDAVISAECSHSFCRGCLLKGLELSRLCPLCRAPVHGTHPNLAAQGALDELPVWCRWRARGCDSRVPRAGKRTHEAYCAFAPVGCPHRALGCAFEGSRAALDAHLLACAFEQLKPFIAATRAQLARLEAQLAAQQQLLARLAGTTAGFAPAAPAAAASATAPAAAPPALQSLQCVATLSGHTRGVTALCLHRGLLFSGSHDATIIVWDMNAPSLPALATLTGHSQTVWSLVVARDLLFSASADATIRCRMLNPPFAHVRELRGHTSRIYTLVTDGNRLYSAGADRSIRVWDASTGNCVKSLSGHSDCVWSLHYKTSTNQLFSGSEDMSIRVWDLTSLTCIHTLTQAPAKVLAVICDSNTLYAASQDCSIKMYNLSNWEPAGVLSGHSWEVWQLALFEGTLLSGSFDHSVRVWDTQAKETVKVLEGHKGYIHALRAYPTEKLIITAGGDKVIKIWRT